eukprot:COSAG01_NODE_31994_length_588_cov_0.580777_1_plen_170_part_10
MAAASIGKVGLLLAVLLGPRTNWGANTGCVRSCSFTSSSATAADASTVCTCTHSWPAARAARRCSPCNPCERSSAVSGQLEAKGTGPSPRRSPHTPHPLKASTIFTFSAGRERCPGFSENRWLSSPSKSKPPTGDQGRTCVTSNIFHRCQPGRSWKRLPLIESDRLARGR